MTTMSKISLLFSLIVFATLSAFSSRGFAEAASNQTYIVLYAQQAVPANARSAIELAGGTLVYSYDAIGVAIARSDSLEFDVELMKDRNVEGVSSTAAAPFSIDDGLTIEATDPLLLDQENASATWGDRLSWRQWDMVQIHVPEAHLVTTGSPDVVVGGIDSGIIPEHPDLAPNVDWDLSVSCIGGVPDQDPAAWRDEGPHGTYTAGVIAAAVNGRGIVGVAPNVRFAAIKGCEYGGNCFSDAIVCSFMWAADHGIDVTSNSYGVYPEKTRNYLCHRDPQEYASWKAVGRAVAYAQQRGVTVVAGNGNHNFDLTHLTGDLTNDCNRIPGQLPGVIGVSSNGNLMQKAYYTSYGVGAIDVVAPGGDERFQRTEDAPNGMVLVTTTDGSYGYVGSGTSLAVPHVAGVAALIISQYGKMPPGQVRAIIEQTADPVPCPENPFNPGPPYDWPANCQGGHGYNSFYGHGQVNAFRAVTHAPQGARYTKLVAFPMSADGAAGGEALPASFGVFNAGNSPESVNYEIADANGWLSNPIVGQVDLDAGTGYRIDFEVQVPTEGGSSTVTLDAATAIPGTPQDQVTSAILLPEPSEWGMLVAGLGLLATLYRTRRRG